MTLRLITAPAAEPVTLAEARAQVRSDPDDTTDDTLLTALIAAARQAAEHLTGRALITQTWERVADAFPPVELELGRPPVQSITSVTYIDTAGTSTVLDPSAYALDDITPPGFVLPAYGTVWPSTLDTPNAVKVRFVCGYGADGDAVPMAIKRWMLLRIGTLYKFREEVAAGVSTSELPSAYTERLLDPFRVWGV